MSIGPASFGQNTRPEPTLPLQPGFYPGITCTLRVRLEEVSDVGKKFTLARELPGEIMSSPVKGAAGRLESVAAAQESATSMMELMQDSGSLYYRAVNRIPKSASIELESYRRASRFELVFAYSDLPIDPLLLRAVGVEIYMDAVDPRDFAQAQQGKYVPDPLGMNKGAAIVPSKDNLAMIGIADEFSVEHGSAGDWITLHGRDLRGVLIDSVAHPARFLDLHLEKDIISVVQEILSRHPFGQFLEVAAADPNEWPGGKIPSPRSVDGITRIHLPAKPESGGVSTDPGSAENPPVAEPNTEGLQQTNAGSEPKKGMPSDPYRNSFWDLIVQYCYLCGAVPYFDNELLRIRPIRTLYTTLETKPADPLVRPFWKSLPRTVELDGSTEKLNLRWFVYGQDIREWKKRRQFNGFRPRIVEVICLVQEGSKKGGTLLKAQYPPETELKVAPPGTPKGERGPNTGQMKAATSHRHRIRDSALFKDAWNVSSYADVTRFPVHGLKQEWQLRALAEAIYWELARGEYTGSIVTKSLASFGGGNSDPDLLRLHPGDAIRILMDQRQLSNTSPLVSSTIDHVRDSYEKEVKRLAETLGGQEYTSGDENFARILAISARNMLELTSYFRATSVKFDWTGGSGVEITVDYQTFLEHRFAEANADAPQSKQQKRGRLRQPIFPDPRQAPPSGTRR